MINVMPKVFFRHGEEILLSLRHIAHFFGKGDASENFRVTR